jgi:hypothetical protein
MGLAAPKSRGVFNTAKVCWTSRRHPKLQGRHFSSKGDIRSLKDAKSGRKGAIFRPKDDKTGQKVSSAALMGFLVTSWQKTGSSMTSNQRWYLRMATSNVAKIRYCQ